MAKLYNLAAMTVASTGTGTITLGSAATINGVLYLSFASAGVANGETVAYSINDIGGSEVGTGVYTTAGTTLTRVPITSTNANAAINMTAAAIVRISPAKADLANLRENNTFTGTTNSFPSLTVSDGASNLFQIGAWGASGNYNIISFNNDLSGTGGIGVVGGGAGDPNLYLVAPTGGAFTFRLNNVNIFQVNNSQFTPTVDNAIALGTASFRWSDIQAVTGTISNNWAVGGSVLSSSATLGVGYATGAGGTVTQLTSRTTTVILNKISGAITLFSAAGSATAASFTVTNSAVAATDVIVLSTKSATNKYLLHVTTVAAGSFEITFNTSGGTSVDAPVINFVVVKGVSA